MSYVFVRRNTPRIVQLRGYTLPRPGRNGRYQQAASYRAECACGWTGATVRSDTAARSEAIRHHCQETH